MVKLLNKVAIVTGAARGLGKAIAMKFVSEGAAVVVTDVMIEQAQETVDEIKSKGGKAIAVQTDVTNRAEVQNLVKTTLDNFKAIHILVNNAGITRHAPILEVTEEDWDMVQAVDLKGVFLCTQAVLPSMIKQRYGKIVNIASECGLGLAMAGSGNYGAAKAGVIQLTKVTAVEAGPYEINTNAIAPGMILTDMTYTRRSKEEVDRFVEERKKVSAIHRLATPESIANLALFLASDDSEHITGQVVLCDDGYQAHIG